MSITTVTPIGHVESIIADRDEPERAHFVRSNMHWQNTVTLCGLRDQDMGHLCPHWTFWPLGQSLPIACPCGIPICKYCLTLAGAY